MKNKIVGRACTIEVPKGVSGYIPEVLKEVKPGEILVIAGKGSATIPTGGITEAFVPKDSR